MTWLLAAPEAFRRDNRAAFRFVFREFVLCAASSICFGRELLAVDGTRIKAVKNKDRNFTRGALAFRSFSTVCRVLRQATLDLAIPDQAITVPV